MQFHIQPNRLRQRLEQVGACGPHPRGGYSRPAFSPQERAARDLVAGWLSTAGFQCRQDAAGNLIARKEGSRSGPALVLGSHLDTVPQGGLFDGALGVLAAVECAVTLAERGESLSHPLEVIAFADEEGTTVGGTFGSRAMAGMIGAEDLAADHQGATLAERMARVGLDPVALPTVLRRPEEFAAYLELHVEQGPYLDRQGIPIGVVDTIVGIWRWSVAIRGKANHAGSTAMVDRQDALMAAASLLVALRQEVMAEVAAGERTVLTVGAMQVEPGVANIVPGRAIFPIEVRDVRGDYLAGFEKRLRSCLAEVGLPFDLELFAHKQPVPLDGEVRQEIRLAAEEMGVRYQPMASGAGHDAMCLARLTRSAMIFVPSRGGFSHCPEEDTDWGQAALGTELLLRTLLRLDRN